MQFAFGPYNGETRSVLLTEQGILPMYVWVERLEGDFVMLQRYYLNTEGDKYVFEATSFGTKSPYVKTYPNGLTKDEIIAKAEAK